MLKVESLVAGYGTLPVVRDVSLEVNKGEIVAIIGANNAGKSTILKNITGLYKPKAGKITFDGAELSAMPSHDIVNKGVVLVPEGRGIFSEMSVQDNLLIGGSANRAKGDRAASLDDVYQLFPILKNRSGQRAGSLSGGEQQMLAVGRGLMAKPEILLLDEPSLGLSPLMVQTLFKTMIELNRRGLSILLVEQNVKLALAVSSRGYVLLHGQVYITGNSKELANDDRVKAAYLGL